MSSQIAPDATIHDIIESLAHHLDYVRGAFGHLHACKRERGDAVLRIGATGRGIAPHYRVEVPFMRKRLFDEGEETDFEIVGAYHGRNHQPLVVEGEEVDILRNEHWSSRVTPYADVEELLGQLRGYKRPAR